MGMATCIECGCDDYHACDGGCTWERVDYEAGMGVCSECAHSVQDWDRGDRTLGEEARMVMAMSAPSADTAQARGEPTARIQILCNALADMTMLFRVIKDIDQSMMHYTFRDNLNMKYQKRKRSDQKFNKWKNRR